MSNPPQNDMLFRSDSFTAVIYATQEVLEHSQIIKLVDQLFKSHYCNQVQRWAFWNHFIFETGIQYAEYLFKNSF